MGRSSILLAIGVLSLSSLEALSQSYVARFSIMGEMANSTSSGGGAPAPPNSAPTASAGPNQVVSSGAAVTLSGAGSSDPDPGDILTFAWTQTSGVSVTLSDPANVSPGFTAPTLLWTNPAASLSFSLVVTDNDGAASPAKTVTVTVNPPDPPAVCDTPGEVCDDGTSTFAGGTYTYFDGKFGPLRWDQANAQCTGLGTGWRLLNSPTERNLLAIPGDPAGVDGMITLWGEKTITGVSSGFVAGVGIVNTCTWSARRYQLRSRNQDGNFVLHTPWGISHNYFVLGSVQTSNNCNTTTPPVNAQTYNFVCMRVTTEPLQ